MRTRWVYGAIGCCWGKYFPHQTFKVKKMYVSSDKYWCTICTLNTKNRMTIWSVGCDVGFSHFFSTSTFKVKDMELFLWQDWCNVCIVLWMWRTGWPFFKRWMWCCVKPIFPTSTFKVKEKHEPSVPTLFRCDVEALGCFWRQNWKGLNGGNALGNQYDQIGDSTKSTLEHAMNKSRKGTASRNRRPC